MRLLSLDESFIYDSITARILNTALYMDLVSVSIAYRAYAFGIDGSIFIYDSIIARISNTAFFTDLINISIAYRVYAFGIVEVIT